MALAPPSILPLLPSIPYPFHLASVLPFIQTHLLPLVPLLLHAHTTVWNHLHGARMSLTSLRARAQSSSHTETRTATQKVKEKKRQRDRQRPELSRGKKPRHYHPCRNTWPDERHPQRIIIRLPHRKYADPREEENPVLTSPCRAPANTDLSSVASRDGNVLKGSRMLSGRRRVGVGAASKTLRYLRSRFHYTTLPEC